MKYTAGQIVEVTENITRHRFEIGERITIVRVNYSPALDLGDYIAKNEIEQWYVTEDEIKAI